MLNKKTLAVFVTIIGLSATASAITVDDVSVNPDVPDHNDSVSVKAFIDGDGNRINSVDIDVRENNNLIVDDKSMNYVSGRDRELQLYEDLNTFTIPDNTSNRYIYDVNVQAIDSLGNQDSLTFTVDVRENETVIDVSEATDKSSKGTLFGIDLIDIIVSIIILIFAWVIATD